MAKSNQELQGKLQAAAPANQRAIVPESLDMEIKQWYHANKKKVIALVGGDEARVALFVSAMYAQINRVPKLKGCTYESLIQCLLYSLGTNLMAGPMQEAYYIPFNNQAVFVPSYQGLVKLMYNSGFVTRITGNVVRYNDDFDFNMGTADLHHRVELGKTTKDRGAKMGAYVVVRNIHGEDLPIWKDAEFIQGIRARSPGAKSSDSPWNSKHESDVDAMWLKTVVRQAVKWVPKDSSMKGMQLSKAIEIDGKEGQDLFDKSQQLLPEDVADVQEALELES